MMLLLFSGEYVLVVYVYSAIAVSAVLRRALLVRVCAGMFVLSVFSVRLRAYH
jgi:hypothetical protein